MEGRRDLGLVAPGDERQVAVRHKARSVTELPLERLGGRRARQLLKLDRRLALGGHRLPHTQNRGDRIEEPAHPRGERSVHPEGVADELPSLPRHGSTDSSEVGCGDAPRLVDRGLTAGKRHGLEVVDALE